MAKRKRHKGHQRARKKKPVPPQQAPTANYALPSTLPVAAPPALEPAPAPVTAPAPGPAPAPLQSFVEPEPAPAPAPPPPTPAPAVVVIVPSPALAPTLAPSLTKETEAPSARRRPKVRKIPRWNFLLGGAVAVALGLPLISITLYVLFTQTTVGQPTVTLDRIARFALLFAAVPAFLAGGGVARLVAHRTAERKSPTPIPLWQPLLIAALAMGAATAGLAYLVAVPIGGLPEQPTAWWPIAAAGFGAGVLTGLAIGQLVGGRQRRHASFAPTATA